MTQEERAGGEAPAPTEAVVIDAAAYPSPVSPEAEAFFAEALRELVASRVPFLLSGTYAVAAYTGIARPTKDLDIFCRAGDLARILGHFRNLGDAIAIEDERWIGKVRRGAHFFDVIFASANGTMPVNDQWFAEARQVEILGTQVRIVAPTELIWSKAFIQLRHRYDGPDVAHVILRQHDQVDWRRLLGAMEAHWEVLLMHLLNFRWIYPSERDRIPRWLLDELFERLRLQLDMPPSQMKVCRGRMFSRVDYQIDVQQWGFADVGGDGEWRHD
ncbi:Nucleotidyltransferase family protein [Rhodovastum atsumiense]|uniref:Nucleotidyltransferase family protein n=1 Tax=Rhodovastum atsumiense TaxID=504468 RepID=A0A5M6IIR0_9PROT|nr:nucleotidyltransferase family protein [Rhodovastum atsumiense]KAA5608094.1 nucleotidyltransferase family protein [Rhodovastum atsumiense]CAH2604899.1 Nucleotidyltransferase family protein [Rhodovastum atsumiense]